MNVSVLKIRKYYFIKFGRLKKVQKKNIKMVKFDNV